jgi:hypothetical protein
MIFSNSIDMVPVRIIFLMFLSIVTLASCSKDDSQNQNPANTALIKTETRVAFPLVFHGGTYTYDNLNRLIYLSHSNKDSFSFKYSGNVITERFSQLLLQEADTFYYFLNSRNLADSASFYNGQIRKKYAYDAEGYLITIQTYDSFDNLHETESYTIQDKNIVNYSKMKIVYHDGNLQTTYKTQIMYDSSGRISKVLYFLDMALDFEHRYEYY